MSIDVLALFIFKS